MLDDLDAFYRVVKKEVNSELEIMKDNIAFGRLWDITTSDSNKSYEYWVGQACAYRAMLDILEKKYKRVAGEEFEKESNDD